MASFARCALCALSSPIASTSRLAPALAPPSAGPSWRRGITFVPRKMKYRVSYKIRNIPWRDSAKGTSLRVGDMGLRTLWPARIKQATFVVMHAQLQRYTRIFKDVRIIWRRFPQRGVAEKGNEVKMGKGRGNFAYLADAVPANRVLLEVVMPGATRPQMVRALRATAARCPAKCEIIDRYALPRVRMGSVPRDYRPQETFHRAATPAYGIVAAGTRTTADLLAEGKRLSTVEASAVPAEPVVVTHGAAAGTRALRKPMRAKPHEWRAAFEALYRRPRSVRPPVASVVSTSATAPVPGPRA